MFHFYTPYTPCKNKKNLLISDTIFGGVGGRYGKEKLVWNGLIT